MRSITTGGVDLLGLRMQVPKHAKRDRVNRETKSKMPLAVKLIPNVCFVGMMPLPISKKAPQE